MGKQGNGLGEGNAKSWNPGSVGDYKRGLQAPTTGKVAEGMRPGAGQKGSKK
jgi:hypothetical protein